MSTIKPTEENVPKKEEKSERQRKLEELRKRRVPPGIPTRNLDYPTREGYVRRVVCDRHGRLDKFLNGGWDFVTQEGLGGESASGALKAGTREGVDSRVSQVVGTHKDNTPMTGYLMEIPEELYQEDQEEKMAGIDALEAGLRAGQDPGGSTRRGPGPNQPGPDGEYVGRQGIKIARGRR